MPGARPVDQYEQQEPPRFDLGTYRPDNMGHGVSQWLSRLQTAGSKVECMVYGGGLAAQATKDSVTWPLAKTGILPAYGPRKDRNAG